MQYNFAQALVAFLIQITGALCQIDQSELVLGIGKCTLAVAIFAAIGMILCGLQNICKWPGIIVVFGIVLPLIPLIVCLVAPKKSSTSTVCTNCAPQDYYRYKLALIYIAVIAGLIVALIGGIMEFQIDLYPPNVTNDPRQSKLYKRNKKNQAQLQKMELQQQQLQQQQQGKQEQENNRGDYNQYQLPIESSNRRRVLQQEDDDDVDDDDDNDYDNHRPLHRNLNQSNAYDRSQNINLDEDEDQRFGRGGRSGVPQSQPRRQLQH